MKKLTLAIFMALVASFALAQGPGGMRGGPGGMRGGPGGGMRMDPKARLEKMTKDLGLNPSQVSKVKVLMDKMMEAGKKLRAAPGDFKSKGPQMKKMRDDYDASLKKVLTPAQFAKFEKMRKDRMSRMGGPGGMRGGPGSPKGPGGPKGGA